MAKVGRPKGTPKTGGMQKGYKAPHTLEKLEMQRLFRERISAQFGPLADALIDKAKGVHHIMARSKDGKWMEVTTPEAMEAALNMGEGYYKIYANDPDVNALRDVLDRVMGKADQALEITVKQTREMTDEELLAEAKALVAGLKGDGARIH